jgi:Ca-activated chloride channel homolog
MFGRFLKGLKRESFSIIDGKNQSDVLYFDDKEVPQSIGIVFDVSGSMGKAALELARGAIVRFARQANKSNQYFLVGFDGQPRLIADWMHDENSLILGLNKLGHIEKKRDGTSLYDAVSLAIEKAVRGPQPRKALLVISDGQDNESETKLSRVREMLKQSDVLVYAIEVSENSDENYEGRAKLQELVKVSGGKAFFPITYVELENAFANVRLELQSLYTVGFRPAAAADGKWHKIRIKVTPPDTFKQRAFVRGREGYFASSSSMSPSGTKPDSSHINDK